MKNTEALNIIKQSLYSTKISRMLAHENIGVVFSDTAHTASFSPETRTLTFPNSTLFLDQDIHELFMMHEVSHALHLPADVFETLKEQDIDFDSFNVVVDIRDERLIKEIYPGVVSTMQRGYEKLLAQDFFGNPEEINFRSFPDRLNVFAKCGIKNAHFVKLDDKEMDFYNRCMQASSIDDVINLTKELQDWKKTIDYNALHQYVTSVVTASQTDEEMTDEELNEKIQEEVERIQNEKVQHIFDDSFKSSIMNNAVVVNYSSIKREDVSCVTAKEYNDYLTNKESLNDSYIKTSLEVVRDIRRSIQTSVDSMVRVFESKKAAMQYKNARTSKTGIVDMNKIHRFKFDEKIFKKSMIVPNAKNHAYYILLDFSGSMGSIYEHVITQLITLTEFFRRIQVPYKVVCFGMNMSESLHKIDYYSVYKQKSSIPSIVREFSNECLLEVMNNTQTTQQHNNAICGLFNTLGFSLGGTPTGYAMLASEHIASEFFKTTGATKKHFIVLTDGSPTDISYWGIHGKTFIMSDNITKKHVISKGNASYTAINCIGKIFEYRHGITFTTMSIVPGSLHEGRTVNFTSTHITDKEKAYYRQNSYAKIVDQYTNNDMYFVRPNDVETDVTDFNIDDKKTTSQIAKSIIKNMKNIKKSRSFLNAIAEKLS